MCGIIGYTGRSDAAQIITDGLKRLEYRGYDSAGLSVFTQDGLITVKTTGRVAALAEKISRSNIRGSVCGIGHTRWATHGEASIKNCHPHTSGKVTVVHNGIIENYHELKSNEKNAVLLSETDTELVAYLINKEYDRTHNPVLSIIRTQKLLRGTYALGIIFDDITDCIFSVKNGSPLLIGLGKNENFISSDTAAFSKHTKEFLRPEDCDIARITPMKIDIFDRYGKAKNLSTETTEHIEESEDSTCLTHHMLREITETPQRMQANFKAMTENGLPAFGKEVTDLFTDGGDIYIIGCGSAFNSGLYGKYFIERLAGIRVHTEIASEFRYSEPLITQRDTAIIISQSGETADSLAALRLLKKMRIKTLAVVNVKESAISREADSVIYTLAGKETAVASTKAFTLQCQTLLLLAVQLGRQRGRLSRNEASELLTSHCDAFNKAIPEITEMAEIFSAAAKIIAEKNDAFFIGRGADSCLVNEASLKLKEISYIHSEGLPAGELKHGTISLIEKGTPVIALATDDASAEKMRSNILEVKARGAFVTGICSRDNEIISDVCDFTITLPDNEPYSLPFSAAAAVQLLAYHTALALRRDIDKPRNLAKSVTVE